MKKSNVVSIKTARDKRKSSASILDVKGELKSLFTTTRSWSTVDSQANGLLYNLLGTIYELYEKIISDPDAYYALKMECAACTRIRKGKMFQVSKRPVIELLIAYALGTDKSKAPTRSLWKKALTRGKRQGIPPRRKAFSAWLHESGGIEGVLSNGKKRAANQAEKFDFDAFSSDFRLDIYPKTPEIPLNDLPSFGDKSFSNRFALVLVTRKAAANATSAEFAAVDVVNDPRLVTKAAERIKNQSEFWI